MARFNVQQREIEVKIVIYGPAFSGKTTNVRRLHGLIPTRFIGELSTLDTEDERTLFFDYFPVKAAGVIEDFHLRLEVFSVPGQAHYRATRHLVLQNADGVIFVADSQPDQLENNRLSLEDLQANLRSYGKVPEDFPVVFQYNKRDLPGALPVEALERALNPRHQPYFEAVAVQGRGVIQPFNAIVDQVKGRLNRSAAARGGRSGGTVDLAGGESPRAPARTVAELVARIGDLKEHRSGEVSKALARVEGPANRSPGGEEGPPPQRGEEPRPPSPQAGGTYDLMEVEPLPDGRVRLLFQDGLGDGGDLEIWIQRDQLAPLIPQRAPVQSREPVEGAPVRPRYPTLLIYVMLVWLAGLSVWLILAGSG